MTSTIATDAPTRVVTAYRWLQRGDLDMARSYLTQLSGTERLEALMNAERLANMLAQLSLPTAEDVARAALQPDSLPEEHLHTYNGLGLCACEMSDPSEAAAWAPDCPSLPDGFALNGRALDACTWCGMADCDERQVHARLDAMSETTWRRRAT